MKLERMNENSKMFFQNNQSKTEDQQKFEIIEKLSEHWNKALKQEYLVPRSLYNYSLDELKQIEKHYLNENNDNVNNDNVKDTITETLQELRDLHLTNEAVDDIRIDGKEIVFDIKCDTDLTGTDEYNGIELRYNKICSISESVKVVKTFDVFDIDEEEEAKILEHASQIAPQIFKINELSFHNNTYEDFKEHIENYKDQFLLNIGGEMYFIRKRIFNKYGFVAVNEKTGELETLTYDDINYIIVDGKKYTFN